MKASEFICNDEVSSYNRWNRALWRYFFPLGNENAILYLDDGILEQVASNAGINLSQGESDWGNSFLKTTLLAKNQIDCFLRQVLIIYRLPAPRIYPTKWDKLVEYLIDKKLNDVPAFFAMLCSIMYLAAKCGTSHNEMRDGAKLYLGDDYRGKFGELVDPLLQKLHFYVSGFNQNRMICGKQRHMSRIKFHMVLPRPLRDDFIDFIEFCNLRWDWNETPYLFYVNNVLIPALARSGKDVLAKKVALQENIPYFKSILQSDLEFGKTLSRFKNSIQDKDIRWRYQLYFDYDGTEHFNIISDNVLPFDIVLLKDRFTMVANDGQADDFIAENVVFKAYAEAKFNFNGLNYNFSNISYGHRDYGRYFIFEEVSDDSYIQVGVPINGNEYYAFISDDTGRIPESWSPISDVKVNGYKLYHIASFSGTLCSKTKGPRLEDTFCRQSMGSWYSIKLEGNNDIFWLPNELGGQQVPIVDLYKNPKGITFFQIPYENTHYLYGTLLVRNGDKDICSDLVRAKFEWEGNQAPLHLNGWGEIEPGELPAQSMPVAPLRKAIVNGYDRSSKSEPCILLQLLFESADKNGRLTKGNMDAVIGFVFSYYGISLLDKKHSIIYGLRRLGYLTEIVESNHFYYQLTAPYLEKTHYSIKGLLNAYLVKGVYSRLMLSQLFSTTGYFHSIRIRPYNSDADSHPEYKCLPDQILLETNSPLSWRVLERPIAERFLTAIEDIQGFVSKFGIERGGELFRGNPPSKLPGMVKIKPRFEVLCIKQGDNLVIHPYYEKDNIIRHIPKHLSRLYCQVQKHVPVCMMAYSQPSKQVDYSRISFVKNMGVPELLDFALCDLNLVIPSYEKVFILYQNKEGFVSDTPWTERRTYKTHAMTNDHSFLLSWLSKLAGKSILYIEKEQDSVYVTRNRNDYSLFFTSNFLSHKDLLTLYEGDRLCAFAIGKDVYYRETLSGLFKKVHGTDVNHTLSDIISGNRSSLYQGNEYGARIEPIIDSRGIQITIIERFYNH